MRWTITLLGLCERFNGQAPKMLKPQHEHIARAFDGSVPLREVSRKCPSKKKHYMKRSYEVIVRHKKCNKPINRVVFWWSPNLFAINRSFAQYYACLLIGRYLDSRVFIGSLSTNHHEECINICQDGQVLLFEVIQGESRYTLCIR